MGNPQQTAIKTASKLKKGDCKRIRAERDLRHCNFKEVNLQNQNFYGVDLSGVNLSGANLYGTHFVNANLSNVNLQGADLRNSNLSGANLTNANLTNTNLMSANFYKSTPVGANFENAKFGSYNYNGVTNFTEANISNADLYYVTNVSNATYNKTIAQDATFNGVNLRSDQREALNKAGAVIYY